MIYIIVLREEKSGHSHNFKGVLSCPNLAHFEVQRISWPSAANIQTFPYLTECAMWALTVAGVHACDLVASLVPQVGNFCDFVLI